MKFKVFNAALVSVLLVVSNLSNVANAGLITINAVNGGYYNSNGSHSGGTHTNTYTSGDMYHSWYGFDLSGLNFTILNSASISIVNSASSSGGDFELYEVNTPYSNLGTVTSLSIFNDLSDGALLASGSVTNASLLATTTFNNVGLSEITNNIGSAWAFGVYNPTGGSGSNGLFGWNSAPQATLTLTFDETTTPVPEPSTLAIFALGMIGLASRRFKKQS